MPLALALLRSNSTRIRTLLVAHPGFDEPLPACDAAYGALGGTPAAHGCTGTVEGDHWREACCDFLEGLYEERFGGEAVDWDGRGWVEEGWGRCTVAVSVGRAARRHCGDWWPVHRCTGRWVENKGFDFWCSVLVANHGWRGSCRSDECWEGTFSFVAIIRI